MKNMIVVGMTACLAATLQAYEWPAKELCKLLETSDTARKSNGGSAFTNGVHWAGGTLPTSDEDCWVPADKTIYAVEDAFPGKSLTIEGMVDSSGISMTVPNFRFLGGSTVSFDSVPCGFAANSVITFQSTAANPVTVSLDRDSATGQSYPMLRKFVSDSQTMVRFRQTQKNPSLCPRWKYCDLTEFFGTLRFDRSSESLKGPMLATNSIPGGTFTTPGNIEIGNGWALVRASSGSPLLSAATVTFETGSTVDSTLSGGANPFVVATKKLNIEAGVRHCATKMGNSSISTYNKADFNLFGLTGEAALAENLPNIENLELCGLPSPDYNYWGDNRLAVVDAADGSGTNMVAYRSGRTVRTITSSISSSNPFTKTTRWKDGLVATAADNAVAGSDITITTWEGAEANFGGLVMAGATLAIKSKTFEVSNLFAGGASAVSTIAVSSDIEKPAAEWKDLGYASVLSGSFLGVYANLDCVATVARELVVDMPVHGAGTVAAKFSATSNNPRGGVEFARVNSDFSGKFLVCSDNDNGKTNSVNGSRMRFYMTDARNVGGPMPQPTFDGFSVRGDSIVIGRNSIDFNQENRGVFIGDRARFVMQHATDNTLAFHCPVTFGGEFVFGNDYPDANYAKVGKGGGTLVMGGAARFYDEASGADGETPVPGRDKLTMLIGKLRPESKAALDGVEITFGEESEGIELDWNATGDLQTFGLYDVKTGVPFTSQRKDGKIPVSFTSLPESSTEKTVRSICTVLSDVADEVCSKMRVVTRPKKNGVKLSVVPNGDATSTICATFEPTGLMLIFR